MSVEIEVQAHPEPAWKIVGASAIGASHIRTGKPCQDALEYTQLSDDVCILVVCDGAGSAAHSEVGSTLTAHTAVSYLEGKLRENLPQDNKEWNTLLSSAFAEARRVLEQKAAETGESLREYASTLVILVLTDAWTAAAMIGDGAAVILTEAEELISLCAPQKGEYANMTNFLIMPDALDRVDIQVREEPAQRAAVFSDGILELALNIAENRPHSPFFTPLFKFVEHLEDEQEAQEQLTGFLNTDRINARTDDDKTLVLASRTRISQDAERQAEAETETPEIPKQEETLDDAGQE